MKRTRIWFAAGRPTIRRCVPWTLMGSSCEPDSSQSVTRTWPRQPEKCNKSAQPQVVRPEPGRGAKAT